MPGRTADQCIDTGERSRRFITRRGLRNCLIGINEEIIGVMMADLRGLRQNA